MIKQNISALAKLAHLNQTITGKFAYIFVRNHHLTAREVDVMDSLRKHTKNNHKASSCR